MRCRRRPALLALAAFVALPALVALVAPGAPAGAGETGAEPPEAEGDRAAAQAVHDLLLADAWEEALARAEEAARRHPGSPAVAGAHGAALLRAGRLVEARDVLVRAAERAGAPDPRGTIARARLEAARGRVAEAERWTERALAAGPEDPEVLYWAADLVPGRERVAELFRRYLAVAGGQPEERVRAARAALETFEKLVETDARPWTPVARPDRVEVPLRAVWTGLRAVDGYTVEVDLDAGDRKPVTLLLDTGAHGLFVLQRIAKKRGFVPLAEAELVGGGGDRRHDVRRGLFPTFDLGGLRFADALATATRAELDPTGRFHGLLGVSAFAGYRVAIDPPGERLTLERLDGEGADGPDAPYWWISGQLLVEVDAGEPQPSLFVLDTGATRTLVSTALAGRVESMRAGAAARVRGFGGEVEGAHAVHGARLAFGAAVLEDSLPAVDLSLASRVAGVELSGMLGLDVLARGVLTLDTGAQTLRFSLPDAGSPARR